MKQLYKFIFLLFLSSLYTNDGKAMGKNNEFENCETLFCLALAQPVFFPQYQYDTIRVEILPMDRTTIIRDTIQLTDSLVYCLDSSYLTGTITSFEYSCPENFTSAIEFAIDSIDLCLSIFPIMTGTDSTCITVCDDLGVCETTIYFITVYEEEVIHDFFDAVDDGVSVSQNKNIMIEVCANDIFPNDERAGTEFMVLPNGLGPNDGEAIVFNDCSIIYKPDEGFCGEDQFSYVRCDSVSCDTAAVYVSVVCTFKVLTGFSPNGDGRNDYFHIDGLEFFPNHTLYVYNRNGNEVLKVTDYQNDWDATWNGTSLPAGTYFYLLETEGPEPNKSGYVHIRR